MPDWLEKIRPLSATLKSIGGGCLEPKRELIGRPKIQILDNRRSFLDLRLVSLAAEHIGAIPRENEAIHAVTGNYNLFHVISAVLSLAGCSIDKLSVATLSFSRENAASVAAMLDSGQVGQVGIACSLYFKAKSESIYLEMLEVMNSRKQQFIAMRIHAKILAMRLADGRTVTVESSANLRSCGNIEQMTIFGSPDLYRFHAGWIDSLFASSP